MGSARRSPANIGLKSRTRQALVLIIVILGGMLVSAALEYKSHAPAAGLHKINSRP